MSPPRILIINSSLKDDPDFVDPIKKVLTHCGSIAEVHHWSEYIHSKKIDGFDAAVISASPRGDNENFQLRLRAFGWVKNFENPVFGICAGHQLTGVSFGGRLITEKEGEEGVCQVRIIKQDSLFRNFDRVLRVVQNHEDSISLPPDFDLLASSDRCRVQAMKHKSRPVYTVQWHAEISNPSILERFYDLILKNENQL